jgi:hypothetical protein
MSRVFALPAALALAVLGTAVGVRAAIAKIQDRMK